MDATCTTPVDPGDLGPGDPDMGTTADDMGPMPSADMGSATMDGGLVADGGSATADDGGPGAFDGGLEADGGDGPSGEDGGCGCRVVAGQRSTNGGSWLFGLPMLVLMVRRRRR